MATLAGPPPSDAGSRARDWLDAYRQLTARGDVLRGGADEAAWTAMFEELATVAGGDLSAARDRVRRHAEDIGTGFRVAGDAEERPWPLSPVPLLIDEDEWATIAAGVAQRAELMETLLADIYGAGTLVERGLIPAALVAGSPGFLRPMVGVEPPGGRHLRFVAMDLGRGPTGEWRVLGDHLRAPAGAGYALENRLAISRAMGGLQQRLNVQRHAGFFAAFREGLAAACQRVEPRIGLLTPGKFNPSYAEQAHLARYLGMLLVEGADLAALDNRLYVRTIAGLKRIDAVWNRLPPRLIDPLAFDSHSQIGVPGLIDAMASGQVVVANMPGAGVLEAPAFLAFLPGLATRLTGRDLILPNLATWWCGQEHERGQVIEDIDRLLIGPAFGVQPMGLDGTRPVPGETIADPARARLLADLQRRPQDYVGQEIVRLSTMPVVTDAGLEARPFTLRVFAARNADGGWVVLPGGLARIGEDSDTSAAVIGEGSWSADVAVHGRQPVAPLSLLPPAHSIHVRRNPGTLPSRVADNFFWLGRYLERGEALLAAVRVMLGNSIDSGGGIALANDTIGRLVALVTAGGGAPEPPSLAAIHIARFARTALDSPDWHSVYKVNCLASSIGEVSRDRLSADMIRLLDAPFPSRGGMLDRAGSLQRRYAALSGLSAEHMGRTAAWCFHDLGRRIERALATTRAVQALGLEGATIDDLSTLLDLADSQISYRQRYMTGIARVPVVDLIALDPHNPRSLAYQVVRIGEHLRALPVLEDDGMEEPQQAEGQALSAIVATATAESLDRTMLDAIERRLGLLSDAVARRYFLQGAEPLRAAGMVLA